MWVFAVIHYKADIYMQVIGSVFFYIVTKLHKVLQQKYIYSE